MLAMQPKPRPRETFPAIQPAIRPTISQPIKQADDGYAGGTPFATVKVTGDSGSETIDIRKNKAEYYAKPSVGGLLTPTLPGGGMAFGFGAGTFRPGELWTTA